MGLDITAYSDLQETDSWVPQGETLPPGYVMFSRAVVGFSNRFSGAPRAAGIKGNVVYSCRVKLAFGCGSYGGYNLWRNKLARAAGYPSAHEVYEAGTRGPFTELLNFADNEGVLGGAVCAKLGADFAAHETRILRAVANDGDFARLYRLWRKAFELAGADGAVEFH